jgi:hypothetical protein
VPVGCPPVFYRGGDMSVSHYKQSKIEAIDVIEDWKLGFCLGNCIKYIARAEHKGQKLSDLEKALWYLDREIKKLKEL